MSIALADLAHPAHWRPAARAGLLLAVCLASAASGLWLYAEERSSMRQAAENRRAELQSRIKTALKESAFLPALLRQEGELAVRLATAEEQLWPAQDSTDALLQAKLARRAEECGLAMESLRPRTSPIATSATPDTATVPAVDIGLSGSYGQLLRFVEQVTAPPMPVLIDTLEIARVERGGDRMLVMTALVTLPKPLDNKDGKK